MKGHETTGSTKRLFFLLRGKTVGQSVADTDKWIKDLLTPRNPSENEKVFERGDKRKEGRKEGRGGEVLVVSFSLSNKIVFILFLFYNDLHILTYV